MRVLLMTWACDLDDISEPGVAARWVKEISKDHDVTVFSVSKPERFGCVRHQFPELHVIEWCDIRVPKRLERFRAIVKPGYLPYYFRARHFLKNLLLEQQFDVVHHLSPFAWRYPSPAAGLGVPLVRGPVAGGLQTPTGIDAKVGRSGSLFMFLRRSDSLRVRCDPVLRSSYRDADHVLMAAPYVQKLLAPLSIRSSSIEIEHGFPDNQELPPAKRTVSQDGKIKLLFVGRIIQTKGLRYAILALSKAKALSKIEFMVIGDGDDLPACRDEVKRLGLYDHVHLLGWKSRQEVEDFYCTADIFLFPSFREPTGGVLLEAMVHGLPCITCAYGGPDYMVDDSCGIKVEPASDDKYVENITAAIDRLVFDTDLRMKMSQQAYCRARDSFGWDAKRKRMSSLYTKLAAYKR